MQRIRGDAEQAQIRVRATPAPRVSSAVGGKPTRLTPRISDNRLLYFNDVAAVLVDPRETQIELSRLPTELVFLDISIAAR